MFIFLLDPQLRTNLYLQPLLRVVPAFYQMNTQEVRLTHTLYPRQGLGLNFLVIQVPLIDE